MGDDARPEDSLTAAELREFRYRLRQEWACHADGRWFTGCFVTSAVCGGAWHRVEYVSRGWNAANFPSGPSVGRLVVYVFAEEM